VKKLKVKKFLKRIIVFNIEILKIHSKLVIENLKRDFSTTGVRRLSLEMTREPSRLLDFRFLDVDLRFEF